MWKPTTQKSRRSDLWYQLLVAAPIFLGLFFIEYPPLFLIGYWSWGGTVHKILSGVFLVLNLLITEFLRKRLGFSNVPKLDSEKNQEPVP